MLCLERNTANGALSFCHLVVDNIPLCRTTPNIGSLIHGLAGRCRDLIN